VTLGAAVLVGLGAAPASAGIQDDLCDRHECNLGGDDELKLGDRLSGMATGKPGVDVRAALYLVEFNSAGAITELVPASEVVTGRVKDNGKTDSLGVTSERVPGHPSGGWLFLGLADDRSLDLTERLGQLVAYGGPSLRLMGDGYAAQKPAGQPLTMDVIGQVNNMRYWVEYRDDAGKWTPVPGQGYYDSTKLPGPPNTRRQLAYTVPSSLTEGRSYQFRVNTSLNYGGSPDAPVANPSFAEWTVIPSRHPVSKDKGKDFDPALPPGQPDPDPDPGDGPGTDPAPEPDPDPSPGPGTTPSPGASGGPGSTGDSGTGNTGADDGPASSGADAGKPPPAAPTPRKKPTADPDATPTTPTGSVWGREPEPGDTSGPLLPASSGKSGLLAALAGLLLAAPLGWWLIVRRRDRRDTGESL